MDKIKTFIESEIYNSVWCDDWEVFEYDCQSLSIVRLNCAWRYRDYAVYYGLYFCAAWAEYLEFINRRYGIAYRRDGWAWNIAPGQLAGVDGDVWRLWYWRTRWQQYKKSTACRSWNLVNFAVPKRSLLLYRAGICMRIAQYRRFFSRPIYFCYNLRYNNELYIYGEFQGSY